jgi:hypothetical protein
MNLSEYNLLKKKRTNLLKKIRSCKNNPTKLAAFKDLLETLNQEITEAEADANIAVYIDLLNKKVTLLKAIGVGRYYHKDVSEKEKELEQVVWSINKMESRDDKQNASQPPQNTPQVTQNTTTSNLNRCNDHSYYIINLGWSNDEENQIVNCIRDFLNRSQYHKVDKTTDASRKENIMSWHYPFDTLEEQTVVKTLRMAATHMLDVLKSWYPETTDAEIFGKISKIYNT